MYQSRSPEPAHAAVTPRRVFVVEEQPNPSTDYFVGPALAALQCEVFRCSGADLPSTGELRDATVVFVRYVPAGWMKLIEAAGPSLHRVVLFMDDDVLDIGASAGMPLRYRFKLARLAALRKGWLRGRAAELWVSTPYLHQKYAAWKPRLVPPSPLYVTGEVIKVFYHGSASHGAEIRWLRPVMEAALGLDSRLAFEIIGGKDVYRLYRGLPRTHVVHPMKWPAYQGFLVNGSRHIGLGPLLDLPFNRSRSYTKFFDITRAGAAGIFAAHSACADMIEHGVDGLVLPLEEEAWIKAILSLARDSSLREAMAESAAKKASQLSRSARESYLGMGDGERAAIE